MGTDNLFKKERLAKERRKESMLLKLKDSILILCEGEKTEPQYFNSIKCNYRLSNVTVEGLGYNTDRVSKEAIKRRKEYSQVWCVFDRDSFPKEKFNRAFEIIKKYPNIHIAYSNEAFELWYILHFDYCDTSITRQQYIKKLDDYLGTKYKKNSPNMYDLIKDKEDSAIRNAKKLMTSYMIFNPVENSPSTNVYELVEILTGKNI